MHTCVHVYTEARGWCWLFSSVTTLCFETGPLAEPGAQRLNKAGWSVSFQGPLVSTSPALGVYPGVEIELRPFWLCDKHFIDSAKFPSPLPDPVVVFPLLLCP